MSVHIPTSETCESAYIILWVPNESTRIMMIIYLSNYNTLVLINAQKILK